MGNDGGSIPTRRELVKSAARAPNMSELKATALESLAFAWAHCGLTSEPLDMENAVSDWRGRLYNYESVLRGLMPDAEVLTNETLETTFAATGIKSLRDIVKLKFKRYTPAGKGQYNAKEIWACPVSLKEMGPSTRAVYLVPCGHVFAEVVFKEVQEHVCPECGEEFTDDNMIAILSTEESDIKKLFLRIDKLRDAGLTHSLKKDKSSGKKKRKVDEVTEGTGKGADKKAKKEKKVEHGAAEGKMEGINNATAASLTAKVLAEQGENAKRRRVEELYKKAELSRA